VGNLIFSFQGDAMNRKAILSVLTLVLMLTSRSARAQGNEPPIPAAPPDGTYILDTLDWLSSSQGEDLNTIVHKLHQDGIAEVFVITLDDCGTDKRTFRKTILQNWGIGYANNNNGLLILVCWYGGDASRRSVEQEFGTGLNGVLSGEITDRVAQEQFIPSFQNEHPGDGLLGMVIYYDAMLRSPKEAPQPTQSSSSSFNPFYVFLFGGFIVIFIISYFVDRKGGATSDGRYYGGDYGGGGDSGSGGGGDSGSSTSF
jgi:uncharacterized membrane protein YgcG